MSSSQISPPFLKEVRKSPFAVSVCPQFLPQGSSATIEFTIVIESSITSNYSLFVDSTPNDISSLLSTADDPTTFISDVSPANGSQKIYFFDLPANESKSFFSFQVTGALNNDSSATTPPLKDLYISRDRCPSPSCPGKSASKPNGRCDWDAHVKVSSKDRLVKVNSVQSAPGRYCKRNKNQKLYKNNLKKGSYVLVFFYFFWHGDVLAMFGENTAGGMINLRICTFSSTFLFCASLLTRLFFSLLANGGASLFSIYSLLFGVFISFFAMIVALRVLENAKEETLVSSCSLFSLVPAGSVVNNQQTPAVMYFYTEDLFPKEKEKIISSSSARSMSQNDHDQSKGTHNSCAGEVR